MSVCLEPKGAVVRPLPQRRLLRAEADVMTPLEALLQHLQVETLILTGLTSNSCIAVTAHDANMRGFDISIPSDWSVRAMRKKHAGTWNSWRDGWCEPPAFDVTKVATHWCSTVSQQADVAH
jgi:hypothetical protein